MISNLEKPLIIKQALVVIGMCTGAFWLGSSLLAPLKPLPTPQPVTAANSLAGPSEADTAPAGRPLPPRIDAIDAGPSLPSPKPVEARPAAHGEGPRQAAPKPSRPIVPAHPPARHDSGRHRGWYKQGKHSDEEQRKDKGDKHSDEEQKGDEGDKHGEGGDDKHGGEGDQ